MTSIKVKFRPSTIEGQPGSIVYAVTHRRTTRQTTTAYKIYPNEWDNKHSRISPTLSTSNRCHVLQSISQHVSWDLMLIKKIVTSLSGKPTEYTADDVISEYISQRSERSFFSYMRGIISRLRHLSRDGTADNYQSALNSLIKFMQGEDLRFEQITSSLMEEYEAWLHRRGVSPNASSAYMRSLRAAYRKSVDDGLVNDIFPFKKVYTGVAKTQKRAISIGEIKKIKDLDLTGKPKLQFIRDIFLFQFYTMGISFIDAAFLKKNDLANGHISYHRHKTGQLIVIPMNNHIKEVIDKHSVPSSPYLLPIIIRPGTDEIRQYDSALRYHNAALKKIAKMAGIFANLTTYVTRHSWASIAKQKGVSLTTISEALGHESTKTTQIYLQSINGEDIRAANILILNDL